MLRLGFGWGVVAELGRPGVGPARSGVGGAAYATADGRHIRHTVPGPHPPVFAFLDLFVFAASGVGVLVALLFTVVKVAAYLFARRQLAKEEVRAWFAELV